MANFYRTLKKRGNVNFKNGINDSSPKDAAGPRSMALIGDDDKPRCRASITHVKFEES